MGGRTNRGPGVINGLNDVCDFGVQTKGSKFVFSELACLFLNKKSWNFGLFGGC